MSVSQYTYLQADKRGAFGPKNYKKDIFISLLYRFELSHRKLQYKRPRQEVHMMITRL